MKKGEGFVRMMTMAFSDVKRWVYPGKSGAEFIHCEGQLRCRELRNLSSED